MGHVMKRNRKDLAAIEKRRARSMNAGAVGCGNPNNPMH
jgi:hypothetical protein